MTSEERFNKDLGIVVRRERNLRGITQKQLGDEINVSFQQVQKYESGINALSTFRLVEVATALKIPAVCLLDQATTLPEYFPDETPEESLELASKIMLLRPKERAAITACIKKLLP